MDDDPAAASARDPSARRRVPVADLALVGAYALALALIAPLSVEGDGTFYYDLTRRLVGDGGIVYAYQWGTSLWNAPFYVAWHALGLPAPVSPPHAQGDPFVDASITLAASVAVLLAVLVARRVVLRLGLPSNLLLLLGLLFGTQLWFFGVFVPSYSHAADALAFTVACYLAVRVWQEDSSSLATALGLVLAWLVTIRYANVAALPGLVLPVLLLRSSRAIVYLLLGAGAGVILLLVPPLLVGTGFGTTADLKRSELGTGFVTSPTTADAFSNLLIPLKMLLSPEHGLFAYAPLCAVGLVGFLFALARPTANRLPLLSIGLAGLGILLVYVAVGGDWIGGGYTYGQRFLTSLAVLTLIGISELWRRTPRLTAALTVACTAWSLFIGLNFAYGWEGVRNDSRNAETIVRLYTSGERTPWEFVRIVGFRLHERFT